jgi:hypothetical protein
MCSKQRKRYTNDNFIRPSGVRAAGWGGEDEGVYLYYEDETPHLRSHLLALHFWFGSYHLQRPVKKLTNKSS